MSKLYNMNHIIENKVTKYKYIIIREDKQNDEYDIELIENPENPVPYFFNRKSTVNSERIEKSYNIIS